MQNRGKQNIGILVDRCGNLSEIELPCSDHDGRLVDRDLYKTAGYKRKTAEFSIQTSWVVTIEGNVFNISLFASCTGSAKSENKYEFPPPVDTVLFFNSCILVNKNEDGQVRRLLISDWEKV